MLGIDILLILKPRIRIFFLDDRFPLVRRQMVDRHAIRQFAPPYAWSVIERDNF